MKTLLLAFSLMLVGTAAQAANMSAEIEQLCEKTKQCVIAHMKETLPPSLQGMAEQAAQTACDVQQQAMQMAKEASPEAEGLKQAQQCVQAMNALSCSELRAGVQPAACQALESQ